MIGKLAEAGGEQGQITRIVFIVSVGQVAGVESGRCWQHHTVEGYAVVINQTRQGGSQTLLARVAVIKQSSHIHRVYRQALGIEQAAMEVLDGVSADQPLAPPQGAGMEQQITRVSHRHQHGAAGQVGRQRRWLKLI